MKKKLKKRCSQNLLSWDPGWPAGRPAGRPARRPAGPPAGQPAGQPASRPACRPAGRDAQNRRSIVIDPANLGLQNRQSSYY